jgi:hypothetical protein
VALPHRFDDHVPTENRAERRILLFVAALGVVNVLVALFALPYSPGLDDPALYTSIYSYQHYGQLSFPDDDIPFMYKHPPTKYWAVGLLVSAGLPLRLATAGLFLASYLLVLAAATACRFKFFQQLAVLFAVPAAVTLCPFISYSPENLAHGEAIGRLRPDDLVLTFWLSGLLWLEAARRERRRLWYGVAGGLCIGLASVTHWFGIPALAAIVVYLAAARLERDPEPGGRGVLIGLGTAAVLLPFWIVIRPYWPQVWTLLSSQGGEPSPGGLAAAWTRHSTDYWFLYQWMKMHASEVWAATALLSVPVIAAFDARLRPRGHLAALRRGPRQPQVDRLRAAGACPLPARDRMARGPADGQDHKLEDQTLGRERVPVADPDVVARTLAPTGVTAHGSVAFAGLAEVRRPSAGRSRRDGRRKILHERGRQLGSERPSRGSRHRFCGHA